jgi:hypothetical protein
MSDISVLLLPGLRYEMYNPNPKDYAQNSSDQNKSLSVKACNLTSRFLFVSGSQRIIMKF